MNGFTMSLLVLVATGCGGDRPLDKSGTSGCGKHPTHQQTAEKIEQAKASTSDTERAGFAACISRIFHELRHFHDKSFTLKEIGQSGPNRLRPVAAGCEGTESGQIRDKSPTTRLRQNPFTFIMVLMVLCIVTIAMANAFDPNSAGFPPSEGKIDLELRVKRTNDEISRLVVEFHAELPRSESVAVGAVYARYSSRFQDSIADQVRTMLQDAKQKRIFIPLENVFFDLATRGVKNERVGLNALRGCIDRKAATVVFFFATNRLFRKTYRALQFVEEWIVDRKLRAVFVKSGVDTDDTKRFRSLLTMHASMDEFAVGMYADNIRAAHEGLLAKSVVIGTITYGYAGEVIEGTTTRRGGVRRRLVIDPVAGDWVKRIFEWYVSDGLSIDAISRRLNVDSAVPSPPKARHRWWSHLSVRKVLSNSRYRGSWRYGVTETIWVSSKDYARQILRREPLKVVQIDDLRLIDDERWYAAQLKLTREQARMAGRKARDGNTASRPRLLNGLFFCPLHGKKLYVGGVNGKYMICMDCRAVPTESRPLYSHLPRALALQKTCDAIAQIVSRDSDLVSRVISSCQAAAQSRQNQDPRLLEAATANVEKLNRKISFLMRNIGETDADQAESEAELRRLRRERTEANAVLDASRHTATRPIVVPSEEEIRQMIAHLGEILVAAANDPSPGAANEVRQFIELLTGGRIELEQMGERRPNAGWLRGTSECGLSIALAQCLTGAEISDASDQQRIIIDYKADPDAVDYELIEKVKELYDQGLLKKEIARQLRIPRNAVASALDAWFSARGLERPDGRSRRATLTVKHLTPPMYREIAPRVKELADAGKLFGDIAIELRVDRNTVTAAWKFWHRSQELTIPDGRTRRKSLDR